MQKQRKKKKKIYKRRNNCCCYHCSCQPNTADGRIPMQSGPLDGSKAGRSLSRGAGEVRRVQGENREGEGGERGCERDGDSGSSWLVQQGLGQLDGKLRGAGKGWFLYQTRPDWTRLCVPQCDLHTIQPHYKSKIL